MCGRYVLRATGRIVAPAFRLWKDPDLKPRYNIALSQPVAVVRCPAEKGERELAFLRWGLIPPWADDPSIGDHLANARSETVAIKRCIQVEAMLGGCRWILRVAPEDGICCF